MIQKLRRANLNHGCKLLKREVQVKELVWLVFSKKKSGTKSGATVSDAYQINWRKVFCCRENQHLRDKFTEERQFLNFFFVFKQFRILKFAMTKWYFQETCFVIFSCYYFFFMRKTFYNVHIFFFIRNQFIRNLELGILK